MRLSARPIGNRKTGIPIPYFLESRTCNTDQASPDIWYWPSGVDGGLTPYVIPPEGESIRGRLIDITADFCGVKES